MANTQSPLCVRGCISCTGGVHEREDKYPVAVLRSHLHVQPEQSRNRVVKVVFLNMLNACNLAFVMPGTLRVMQCFLF
jgi:hypothetical protein